jgi:hypothetical protein
MALLRQDREGGQIISTHSKSSNFKASKLRRDSKSGTFFYTESVPFSTSSSKTGFQQYFQIRDANLAKVFGSL